MPKVPSSTLPPMRQLPKVSEIDLLIAVAQMHEMGRLIAKEPPPMERPSE